MTTFSGEDIESARKIFAGTCDFMRGITTLDVVGIATDHCVRATALDGVREGFTVRVVEGLTAAVSPAGLPALRQELAAAGVRVTER